MTLFGETKNGPLLRALIRDELNNNFVSDISGINLDEKETVLHEKVKMAIASPIRPRLWSKVMVAASLLIGLMVGYLYYTHRSEIKNRESFTAQVHPGGHGAILTLSDGKKIAVGKETKNGIIQQSGALINLSTQGIVYDRNQETTGNPQYNTLETPVGEQFFLTLSDGTKVWLNAGSSIRYPVKFQGAGREVTVTGEVYFEVKHDDRMPFKVLAEQTVIEDLGTSFVINNYPDEPGEKVTLLEGALRFRSGGQEIKELKPGQQVLMNRTTMQVEVTKADVASAIAWKNGLFKFDHADIRTVMRQISRWYNVKVEYQGDVPSKKLTGEFYRSATAQEALQILQYAHIPFQLTNKTIIITTN